MSKVRGGNENEPYQERAMKTEKRINKAATKVANPEQKVADAMRKLAAKLEKQWDEGKRSRQIGLGDLTETLLVIAEELDPE